MTISKQGFDLLKVKHIDLNLDFGDYSFMVQDRNFLNVLCH